jgi:predicted RNA methylase
VNVPDGILAMQQELDEVREAERKRRQEDLDQWLTSPGVAASFIEWSRIRPDDVLLEPAAGEGALVPAGHPYVLAFDIDPERLVELRKHHPQAQSVCGDFLTMPVPASPLADVCVQNPPYGGSGEGTFIRQSLLWAPRCCALTRTAALHGKDRFDVCWRYVRPTRIAFLVRRPKFLYPFGEATEHTARHEYAAIECVLRARPLESVDELHSDPVEVSFVRWE